MKVIETGRPDVLEMRGGGGWLMLFGLPFFLIGLGVLGMGVGVIPVKGGPPVLIAIPFGAVFALAGSIFIFGRRGCIMDQKRRTVEYWTRFFVPISRKTYSFDQMDRVSITREIRRTDKSSYTVYPVRILGSELKLDLGESQKYEKSRALAERVAGFLELPLVDASTGVEVVRRPDELDKSIKERLEEHPEELELPPEPPDLRTRILRKGDAVRLEIPGGGIQVLQRAILVVVLFIEIVVASVIVFFLFQSGQNAPPLPMKMVFGVFLVMGLVVPFFVYRQIVSRLNGEVTIIATPRTIEVIRPGAFGKRRDVLSVDEIEELFVTPAEAMVQSGAGGTAQQIPQFLVGLVQPPIVIRTDRMVIQFGSQLPKDEKEFLVAVLKHAIRGG